MPRILIIGAGGHAQVVADILLAMHIQNPSIEPIGYLDDNIRLSGHLLLDLPVYGVITDLKNVKHDAIIIGIGDNSVRKRLYDQFRCEGEPLISAVHPCAVVTPSAQIGIGTVVCAGVVVNPATVIGANVILNTSCSVDHHSRVGDHAHIAPGAHLGGEIEIGQGVLVGIGATVMPRCQIGDWSIVGAGACVTKSVPAGLTVVGVPAKPLVVRN